MKLTTIDGEEHYGDTLVPVKDGEALQLIGPASETATVPIDDLRSVIDP